MAKTTNASSMEHSAESRSYLSRRFGRAQFAILTWAMLAVVSAGGAVGVLNEYHATGWLLTFGISVAASAASSVFAPITLILLFNSLFSLYSIPHVFFQIDVMSLPTNEGLPLLTQTNWVIALFVSTLMLWVSSIDQERSPYRDFNGIKTSLRLPNAPGLFYLGLGIIALATHVGIRGAVVVGVEGGYSIYVENLQAASGLQEYLLVPFLLTGLLAKSRFQKFLWYLVLAFFVVKLLLLGLRVVALMGVLTGFWFLGLQWTFRRLLLLFFFGYIAFSFLGLLKGALTSEQLLTSLFFELHGDGLVSHHSNVLWASSVMLGLIDDGLIDPYRRAELLIYMTANAMIPSGILQSALDTAYFGSWLQEMGYTSGGGHAAVFALVAGGVPGVVALASLLGWAVRRSLSADSEVLTGAIRCWLLLAMITFPRWISYDIGNFFFRLPIYAAILYLMLIMLAKTSGQSARLNN